MSHSKSKSTNNDLEAILTFVDRSQGLRARVSEMGKISITQESDGKIFRFDSLDLVEVLKRADSDRKPFVQINFHGSKKVLLTETLVGFKPKETLGLDMTRIPKVVTTPDLVSVYDAIEESLASGFTTMRSRF